MIDTATSTNRLATLWTWWATPLPGLSKGEQRFHAVGAVGIPQGWQMHLLYVALFAWWGVWPLAWANMLSVGIWTSVLLLFRRGRQLPMFALLWLEVTLHGALVIYLLGWGFGAQYFLILVTLVSFMAPWRRSVSLGLTALNAAIFIAFYYYAETHTPLYTVPALQLAALNVINIVAVFGMAAATVLYYITVADRAEAALAAEHALSEALLNNVLPVSIAARLKQDSGIIAEAFASASVLFADIVGFTTFSEQVTPQELVDVLNGVFSRFDELVDEFGLEKIKTVGDAYMVASGIPTPLEDHAERLAGFALAIRDALEAYNLEMGTDLRLRIGLSSGPVVAGVIGKRRFLYDLWGDSVNTASRMESHGRPGAIQISEATRALLDGKFLIAERGLIDVKGKGPMRTYFLVGRAA